MTSNRSRASLGGLTEWLLKSSLEGRSTGEILEHLTRNLIAAGIPLWRSHIAVTALHPTHGAFGFDWSCEDLDLVVNEYPRPEQNLDSWVASPFYFMATNGLSEYREQLWCGDEQSRFGSLQRFQELGATDYFATLTLFGRPLTDLKEASLSGHVPAMAASWTTDAPSGFSDQHIQFLTETLPALGSVLRAASIEQTAEDLLAVYLGHNASSRVLSGNITRGSLEKIRALILYFDLRGFTKLSEAEPGERVIGMLNDYFGAVVPVIESHGGNVLKFMGDGLLAIIDLEQRAAANAAAIDAAISIREVMGLTTNRRQERSLSTTGFSLALHVGEVLYGNIGSQERLDFTVIGPAVNTAARIMELCGTLDQDIIVSRDVASPVLSSRPELVSLGHHDLRSISKSQELFAVAS